VQKYIQKIDDMGGALEAIRKGYIQAEITLSAYNYQRAVDKGEQTVSVLIKIP
jgi:methylmalonyl-CoA mutase N-terminal domain/subunit